MSLLVLIGMRNKNSTSPHLCESPSTPFPNLESLMEDCTPKVVGPTFSMDGLGLGSLCRTGSINGEGGEGGGGVGSGESSVGLVGDPLTPFVVGDSMLENPIGEAGDKSMGECILPVAEVTDDTDAWESSPPGDSGLLEGKDAVVMFALAISFLDLFRRLTLTGFILILFVVAGGSTGSTAAAALLVLIVLLLLLLLLLLLQRQ